MDIRPLSKLTHREVVDMGRAAAERGECPNEANPFGAFTWQRGAFACGYAERARELQPTA